VMSGEWRAVAGRKTKLEIRNSKFGSGQITKLERRKIEIRKTVTDRVHTVGHLARIRKTKFETRNSVQDRLPAPGGIGRAKFETRNSKIGDTD